MGDPRLWRAAVRDLENLLPEHQPGHRYLVHDADQPLPGYVKDLRFHGIILGPTFLCARFSAHVLKATLESYDFVRASDAVKIAMPQDDYDCSAILDRWMSDWQVDAVYAACTGHWDILYPTYSRTGRIRQGYTGYVADSWITGWQQPKPFAERSIDVSYRAGKLPPNYGRIGYIKGVIGERFAAHPATTGMTLDISTEAKDMIPGARWHAFMSDSRFCLATNTGSSLLDPEGDIRRCVEQRLIQSPDASFAEVEAHCFPGQDGTYHFTAISPRNIEAALAHTVQLATPGPYGGILSADDHYIALEPDCSNAADVVARMKDRALVDRIAKQAKEAVLGVPELRATNHATRLIEQIADGVGAKRTQASSETEMQNAMARYATDVTATADAFWARRRRRQQLRDVAVALGARKLKRLLGARLN